MATMLAARLDTPGKKMTMEKVEVPEPKAGQVRVKVKAAGVCLSDVHLIDGSVVGPYQLPKVTLGHEIAGVVDKLGEGVDAVKTGTRVLVNPADGARLPDRAVSNTQPLAPPHRASCRRGA